MMNVSSFRVGFSMDLASHLTMSVTAFFVSADSIKAMKSALDFYGISYDYHVLGFDNLPL